MNSNRQIDYLKAKAIRAVSFNNAPLRLAGREHPDS